MHFTTVALPLALAVAASSTPLSKRQAPGAPDRFGLFWAAQTVAGGSTTPEEQILVVNGCLNQNTNSFHSCIASSPTRPGNQTEPLLLDKFLVFTSNYADANAGQALIVNNVNDAPFDLTPAHNGFVAPQSYTKDGFSVTIDSVLAWNGKTDRFYQCLFFLPPGGNHPLLALDPVDTNALGNAGCHQRNILVKTSAIA